MNKEVYQEAFGVCDITSDAMKEAIDLWRRLYFGHQEPGQDASQRIAFTVVNKLTGAVFGEYTATSQDPVTQQILQALEQVRLEAFSQTLVEGECYLKPWVEDGQFRFSVIPRHNLAVFAKTHTGRPVDVGMCRKSWEGNNCYTLLERRKEAPDGRLEITNSLHCSAGGRSLGKKVPLASREEYKNIARQYYFFRQVPGLGLVRIKVPVLNCVDGSADGVSVYAAAAGLIHNIDCNEKQLSEEFQRGESRIIASRDLLTQQGLQDHVFVGLDDDPERVGITVYSPQLRQGAFLERKLEYLRNVESVVGLRRGMLADVNVEERTATEIASSMADFNLTVISLQRMWQQAVEQAVQICKCLAQEFWLTEPTAELSMDWGNGVLYDQHSQWDQYAQMVREGLLKPEVALGWRFGMKADTPQQQAAIREKYMPTEQEKR